MFLFFLMSDPPSPIPKPDLDDLMNTYGTEILRLCTLYLKDYHLAQDAVQETFLKVYTKFAGFRGQCSIKTWITTIAMNVCRDTMRRHSYSERPLFLPEDADAQEEYVERKLAAAQDSDAPDVDTRMTLLQAVTDLPEIYRKTILLYYYNGFSTAEIAHILHCPQATINVRLKRGRDMLRRVLTD
ncbi:MAG: sigma-70 family RNA polymerase sigma factor [Clostridiaceae bacterium]|nr:sigma-70 family RNA polymerase sigma factor [Clostridiaceae bacterium]